MPVRPSKLRQLSSALTLVGCIVCPFATAQTDANTAAAWRATSRLGYGPTPATAQAAEQNPKAWASRDRKSVV